MIGKSITLFMKFDRNFLEDLYISINQFFYILFHLVVEIDLYGFMLYIIGFKIAFFFMVLYMRHSY